MKNIEIKMKLAKTGIKQWQVAERLRIGESTLCRMMRRELSPERKAAVLGAIHEIQAERKSEAL